MAETLYLCATSIGNPEDIIFRVLRTLKEVDLIAVEDAHYNIKLLNYFDIKTSMTSHHEYNKVDKVKYLVGRLEEGVNVTLITDTGTPGISDSGKELVRQCYEAGIQVTSLPDPAACITALTVSGLPTRRLCFEALLPSEKGDKKEYVRTLEELKQEARTIIMYEAPRHLVRILEDLYKVLRDKNITICRGLAKRCKTACRTTFRKSLECCHQGEPGGEYVTVIEGKPLEKLRKEQTSRWKDMEIQKCLVCYTDQGMDKKEATKAVAKDRGITKRDVYRKFL